MLELKRRQDTPDSPEALASIPALERSDLDKQVKKIPLEVIPLHGSRLLYHDIFTNGILYLDLGFDLHTLPQECLPYVPLFGQALLETGTAREDFVQLSQRIGQNTGGIWTSLLTTTVFGQKQGVTWMFLRGKSTVAQTEALLSILRDVLETARLDNRERIRQMVLEAKSELEAMLIPAGSRVVNQRLRSRFNEAAWAAERMTGVDNLLFVRQLVEQIDHDWPSVQKIFEQIRGTLLNRRSMVFNVTLDQQNWGQVQPRLEAFIASLPEKEASQQAWSPPAPSGYEGLVIPAQVNYVGKGADLFSLGYELHGSILVIVNHLQTTWLWEKVRVQGGAYGGTCAFDQSSGVFTYISYRDPNLLNTLEVYDQTAEFLRRVSLSESELTRSIIGAVGEMDQYQLPDAQGYTSMARYLAGLSDEARQKLRDQLLSTSEADFHQLGEVLGKLRQAGLVVVMGPADGLEAARKQFADRRLTFEMVKVL